MFRVRREQMEVFEARARERFERQLAAHLREEFPEACAAMGDEEVQAVVTWAIDRGAEYGLITEEQVSLFACSAFLLDPRYETMREYRTAKRILDDPDYPTGDQRIDALYREIERIRGDKEDEEDRESDD